MEEQIIRVSCVGDSITVGQGIEDLEDIYPVQLNCLLGSKYTVNPYLGKSGAAVWHLSPLPYTTTGQFIKAKNWTADVLVVCLGSNDSVNQINDRFNEEFIEDYLTLLSNLKMNSPAAKTFVCKIPPIFGPIMPPLLKEFLKSTDLLLKLRIALALL